MLLETTRVFIRSLTEMDFPEIYRMQSDPEIMRYIRAAVAEEQLVRERMAAWVDYEQKNPDLGVWGIFLKETGAFAGYVTGRHVGFDPAIAEYEVGYVIAPEHWGKGLATEVTQRVCRHLFETFKVAEIVAFTDPENHPSQHVLRKCLFIETGRRHVYGGNRRSLNC